MYTELEVIIYICIVLCYTGRDVGFGEASPEAKAAENLHNFFTFVAVKIVAAQLEVPFSFSTLMAFLAICFYNHVLACIHSNYGHSFKIENSQDLFEQQFTDHYSSSLFLTEIFVQFYTIHAAHPLNLPYYYCVNLVVIFTNNS